MGKPKVHCEHKSMVTPEELMDHPRNANRHPKHQISALAANIEAFGWRHPIVVSKRSGYIVMGHGRRDAALLLGCQAPVDYQAFESEDEELAVLVADNVIPELADMDDEILAANKELLEEAGIDLKSIGFDAEELQKEIEEDEGLSLGDGKYIVEIEVNNEEQQERVFNEMKSKGYTCRVLKL